MVVSLTRDAERLRRLQALTDAALAHLDLEQLLAALLERTRDLLEVETCAVLLLDEETNELVARAAVGIEEEVEQGVRIPVGRGFAGRVAAERSPVVLDDVDHAQVLNPLLHEKGIKSLLGVPLLVGGKAIGVLHVGTLSPRSFVAEDVELLQFAADRAAIAIAHARLFEMERAARRRVEYVQAVTDAALAHLDFDGLMVVLLPRIRSILHADTCVVLLLDEENQELVARAAVGLEEEVEQGVRVPLGRGFAGRVAKYKRSIVLSDVATADVVNPILREKGLKSMVGVPLLVGGEAIGVLHVGTLTHRVFKSEEVELLELVAARVAIAIERAQLHEETVALDRMKQNFVAIASHELRTPATSVYGALATLAVREDALSDETRRQLISTGYEQGARLCRLIEELLDLSRLDSADVKVAPHPVVLRSMLTDVISETLPAGVDIDLDVPADLATVVDPRVVERVITNLLANAVRYGRPPISISARQCDRHLRVAVSDAGTGVPEELRERLFDRFVRGEKGSGSGSGLGLAIARSHPSNSEEAIQRNLAFFSQWKPPDGFEFKGFWGFADGSGGVSIVETDSAATIAKATAPFAPWLRFSTTPILPVEEASAIAGEAAAARASLGG